MRHSTRTPASLAAAFAALLLLAGCSSSSGGYSDAVEHLDSGVVAADEAAAPDAVARDGVREQALVVTGSITITADDPIAAAEEATAITLAAGGRVDSRRQYAPRDGDAGSATLTLRIPADELEDVRERLAELGSVDETLFDSVDVGTQQRDLDTRISTLRASIARYTAWLADADTTSDLIELEQAISSRQAELEMLEAQQRDLADQVAMSTVTLTLRSLAAAPPPAGPGDFWSGLVAGWNAFVGFWAGVLIVLGVALPWLVLVGAGAALTVWLVRRRRPRPQPVVDQSAERMSESSASP